MSRVDLRRFELLTVTVQRCCSTNWSYRPVILDRLELPTSSMSRKRANQLRYRIKFLSNRHERIQRTGHILR